MVRFILHIAGFAAATALALTATTLGMAYVSPWLVFLTPGLGLLAFMVLERPYRWIPEGPVSDSGRLWGWSWVRIRNRVRWVRGALAAELRAREAPDGPEWAATPDGMACVLPRPDIPRPMFRAALMNVGVHLVLLALGGAVLVTWQLDNFPMEKGEVLRDANIFAALVFLVAGAGADFVLLLALLAILGVWLAIPMSVSFFFTRAVGLGGTEVEIRSALLTVKDAMRTQRFTLGQGHTSSMGWDTLGSWLRLTHGEQTIDIRAQHGALQALERRLADVRVEGDADDIPSSLHALTGPDGNGPSGDVLSGDVARRPGDPEPPMQD